MNTNEDYSDETIQKVTDSLLTLIELSDDLVDADNYLDIETGGPPYEPCDANKMFKKVKEALKSNGEPICINFSETEYPYAIKELLSLMDEVRAKSEGTDLTLITPKRSFQIVDPVSDLAEAMRHHDETIKLNIEDGYVQLVHGEFLIGLTAVNKGLYGDYHPPLNSYIAVEAVLPSNQKFDEKVVSDIINAFLFELAASHNIVFRRGQFVDYEDYFPEWIDDDWEFDLRFRPLEDSNEGISLFNAASHVSDPMLRFFSFYKVLEHFGPVVNKLEMQDLMRRKLDSPEALSPTADFIDEIFRVSKPYHQKQNDKSLMRGVLSNAVDLDGLRKFLPVRIRSLKALELAETVCDTRNLVAHAKAGYERTGNECEGDDLKQLTEFLIRAGSQAIRWYNRLPIHQRLPSDKE